jgi:hypothetical protein
VLVRKLFERAAQHNVAINVSKLVFAQPSAKFGGYIVNSTGFSPHPDLMKAIRDFPVPRNATDVRSFHGLCQQVGHFSTKVAESLKPLSPLLKKGLHLGMDDDTRPGFLIRKKSFIRNH